MGSYLEVRSSQGVRLVALEEGSITIGRSPDCDLHLTDDAKASWLHAKLEVLGEGWCVTDLSSTNGTYVNGQRVSASQPLYDGDELLVGSTDLVVRSEARKHAPTEGVEPPPELTPRERDVLLALFPSTSTTEFFTEPASTREMAAALFVSEAAVKQHLLRLYDKFGIHGDGERRRVRLANEALRRRAVTLADIRRPR
jgi:pSer/pThr/pTyr-binding forkhead associated (FHA) protein